MDEQLRGDERAGRVPISQLIRAGRLDPERVALAAYVGHVEARGCCEPASLRIYAAGASRWSAVRRVLRHGGLNRQAVVPLLCELGERALGAAGDAREACERAFQAAREWAACPCDLHRRMASLAGEYLEDVQRDAEPAWLEQPEVDMVGLARWTAALTAARTCAEEAAFALMPGIPPAGEQVAKAAADAAPDREAEEAWQASVLAARLLDPAWTCELDGPS